MIILYRLHRILPLFCKIFPVKKFFFTNTILSLKYSCFLHLNHVVASLDLHRKKYKIPSIKIAETIHQITKMYERVFCSNQNMNSKIILEKSLPSFDILTVLRGTKITGSEYITIQQNYHV